jgi:hypothetical protein
MDRTSKLPNNSNSSLNHSADSQGVEGVRRRSFHSRCFCKVRNILKKTLSFFFRGWSQSFADFWFSHEICLGNLPLKKERRMAYLLYGYKQWGLPGRAVSVHFYKLGVTTATICCSVNIIPGQPVLFLPDTTHSVTSFNRKQCLASFFAAHQLVRLKFVTV